MLPFDPPENITTERLILRLARHTDIDGFYSIVSDSRVMSGVWPKPITDRAFALKVLGQLIERGALKQEYHWMVTTKEAPDLPLGWMITRNDITRVFPRCIKLQAQDAINTGKFWAYDAWGNGYATEAQRALVSWVLAQQGVNHMYALIEEENAASRKVAEKCGYVFVAIIKDVYPNPLGAHKNAAHYRAGK